MATELKPCPFCGGRAELAVGEHIAVDAMVRCTKCSAEGPLFDCGDDTPAGLEQNKVVASAHWNNRTAEKKT